MVSINPFKLQANIIAGAKQPEAAPVAQESIAPVAPVVEAPPQDNTQTLRRQQDVAANIGRAGIQLGSLNKPQGLSPRVENTLTAFANANPEQQNAIFTAMQFDLNS